MLKTQCFGMQSLMWKHSKTIFHKLFVLGKHSTPQHPVATILIVTKQRMLYVLEVCTNLMRTTGFKFTFHQAYITEVFNHTVMCNSRFSIIALRKHTHHLAVFQAAADMAFNGAFSRLWQTPYKRMIQSL